jgi:hypothetical protein
MSQKKFTPPVYGKLGKKVKDLFKKKYEYETKVTTKHRTRTSGLSFEAGGSLCAPISGNFKGKYKDKKFGEVEVEATTGGKTWATSKFDQIAKGLEVNYAAGMDPKKKGINNRLSAEFAQEYIAVSGAVDVLTADAATTAIVEAAGVVGFEGVSVGAQCVVDVNTQKPKDFNLGLEYTRDATTVTLLTENKGEVVRAFAVHQINPNYLVGVQFDFCPQQAAKEKQRVLSVGTEYQIDVDTSVKAKADSTGGIETAIQHNLQNPALQVGLAAAFSRKSANCLSAEKFGISFTFGDY